MAKGKFGGFGGGGMNMQAMMKQDVYKRQVHDCVFS